MTKKIFKSIGLIAFAIAVSIGSFFVPMQNRGTSHLASANTSSSIYIFDGSNIYTPILRQDGNQIVDYLLFGMNFEIDNNAETITLDFDNCSGYWSMNRMDGTMNYANLIVNANRSSGLDFDYIFTGSDSGSPFVWQVPYYSWVTSSTFAMAVNGSSGVPGEIIGCEIGFINTTFANFSYPSNYVKYFDSNNNYIAFYLRTVSSNTVNNFYETRTYYFNSALDLDDNQLFNQGYQQGLADNQTNIYNNGYDTGFDDGFEDGKITGAVEANDYSFFSLFGAIFDAPVSLFTSLLNFEFLGINLWSFVTSLLTLAIILFVIKLFIRR